MFIRHFVKTRRHVLMIWTVVALLVALLVVVLARAETLAANRVAAAPDLTSVTRA